MELPKDEYRPTTLGELKAALARLDLPDDTPLMSNSRSGQPDGTYVGYIIVAPREVEELRTSGGWSRYRRPDVENKAGEGLIRTLYVVG